MDIDEGNINDRCRQVEHNSLPHDGQLAVFGTSAAISRWQGDLIRRFWVPKTWDIFLDASACRSDFFSDLWGTG